MATVLLVSGIGDSNVLFFFFLSLGFFTGDSTLEGLLLRTASELELRIGVRALPLPHTGSFTSFAFALFDLARLATGATGSSKTLLSFADFTSCVSSNPAADWAYFSLRYVPPLD